MSNHDELTRAQIRDALGQTMRNLREQADLSQEGVALACGINRGYMSGLERGKHSPGLEIIYRMLPVLGVDFVEFAVEFDYTLRRTTGKRDA